MTKLLPIARLHRRLRRVVPFACDHDGHLRFISILGVKCRRCKEEFLYTGNAIGGGGDYPESDWWSAELYHQHKREF